MRRNKFVFMVYAILLGSLAFCLETPSSSGASTTAGWIGRLIVGKGVKQASSETEANDGQDGGFAGDTEKYQSDQAVSTDERKLLHLNPIVRCGDDSMALHIQGTRMPNFMVDGGGEGLKSMSKMPEHCGYSVRRARRDIHIIVPYRGCHVAQQGDDHVLPLRLLSLPLQMSCPAAPFTDASSVSATAASDPQVLAYPVQPAYPAAPPYPPGPTGYSSYWVQPTASSAAASPIALPASDPQVLAYPVQPAYPAAPPSYPPGPTGYSSYWVQPTASSAAASPIALPASDPQVLAYPVQPAYPAAPPYYPPGPTGYSSYWVPSPPSVATSPTTTVLAAEPQVLAYPFQPVYPVAPPYYPLGPKGYNNYWHYTSRYPNDHHFYPHILRPPFQHADPDDTWQRLRDYSRYGFSHAHSHEPSKTEDSAPAEVVASGSTKKHSGPLQHVALAAKKTS